MSKSRFSFQLDDDSKIWLQKQADSFGITLSAMINICISNYRDYYAALKQLPDMMHLLDLIMQQEGKKK